MSFVRAANFAPQTPSSWFNFPQQHIRNFCRSIIPTSLFYSGAEGGGVITYSSQKSFFCLFGYPLMLCFTIISPACLPCPHFGLYTPNLCLQALTISPHCGHLWNIRQMFHSGELPKFWVQNIVSSQAPRSSVSETSHCCHAHARYISQCFNAFFLNFCRSRRSGSAIWGTGDPLPISPKLSIFGK